MKWQHASTRQRGWSVEVLVSRGYVVAQLDKFDNGRCYGNVFGQRTGALIGGKRRARRVIRKRARADTSGLAAFIREIT